MGNARPRTMRLVLLTVIGGIGWACIFCPLVSARTPSALSAVESLAVLPFTDLRSPGKYTWLGAFFHEFLGAHLASAGKAALMAPRTAELWRRRLDLDALEALTADQQESIGVAALLQGTVQSVLRTVRVQVQVTLLGHVVLNPQSGGVFAFDLERIQPREAMARILAVAQPPLFPGESPVALPLPERWALVERFMLAKRAAQDPAAPRNPKPHQERLREFTSTPGFSSIAHQTLAELSLATGLLNQAGSARRSEWLSRARAAAESAILAGPDNAQAHAVLAEIFFFFRNDYQAKTISSIAGLKNPLNGLAHLVQGLAAGLSTGFGTQQYRKALRVNPFLLAKNLPPGEALYQYGVLEALLVNSEMARAKRRNPGGQDSQQAFQQGVSLFAEKRWDDADLAFQRATEQDEYDPRPWLYRYRILLETGRHHESVPLFQELAAEHPASMDTLFYLGVAYKRSGLKKKAQEAFRQVMAERPNDPLVLHEIAGWALEEEKWEEAHQILRRVLSALPNHQPAWTSLGKALLNLERFDAARQALARSLELAPGDERALALMRALPKP